MSVTITITDPSSTPAEELQAVIVMLRGFTSAAAPIGLVTPAPSDDAAWREATALAEVPPPPHTGGVIELPSTAVFGSSTAPAYIPAPPAPPPPVVAPGVPLDKEGLPWDGRIHASTKTKTVEGLWKKKRNLDPAFLASVIDELKATMGAPAIVPPPPPVTSVVPPPPPAIPGPTFAEFMAKVTAGVTEGTFTREDVTAACIAQGIPNLPGLINRPDLIPAVALGLGLTV